MSEDRRTDVIIWMDLHRNTVGDLSELYDIMFDMTGGDYDDQWWIEGSRACFSLNDLSDMQIERMRAIIDGKIWDGPKPVVN